MTDQTQRDDLKPCPFCGGPAELERDSDHHGSWFNLGCARHWGGGGVAREDACLGGRVFYTEDAENESKAITAWNTRPEAADRIERLERALAKVLPMLTDLDEYMKRPERGEWGVECAVCRNEWFEPGDLAAIEEATAALKGQEG